MKQAERTKVETKSKSECISGSLEYLSGRNYKSFVAA